MSMGPINLAASIAATQTNSARGGESARNTEESSKAQALDKVTDAAGELTLSENQQSGDRDADGHEFNVMERKKKKLEAEAEAAESERHSRDATGTVGKGFDFSG